MVPLPIIVRSIAKVNPAVSFFDCEDIRFIILHPLQRASAVYVDIKRCFFRTNDFDSLGYGRLCEALPFFPCGADVLAPICPLTVIREVDLNEYVVRGASEGEQKAVLVESNGTVLFARPWGALVNRSEELFQLVKIVTAALLALEALYRQLGYGRLHRGARDLCPVPEGATVERVAHVYRLVYAVGDVDLDDVLALSRENDQRAPLVSA